MDASGFVAIQAAHRLGGFGSFRPSLAEAARCYATLVGSKGTLAWSEAEKLPYPVNGWTGRAGAPHKLGTRAPGVKEFKFRDTLLSLLAAGLDFDTVIDMEDRRVRALHGPGHEICPTVCFNRTASALGRVLWHMPGALHKIGAQEFLGPFPDPDALPFAQRSPKLVWRGNITGRAGSGAAPILERFRFHRIFSEVERGKCDMAWAAARLGEFPRYRFVRRLSGTPLADVAFVHQPELHPRSESLMRPLQKDPMRQREQARHKYIAVLRGADLASSFFWTMNSGSLALVMDSPWESFASVHFHPWQHYVPFREDLSDLEERLAWCESHQAECAAMTQAAREVCRWLERQDLREEADRAVVDGLRQRVSSSTGKLHYELFGEELRRSSKAESRPDRRAARRQVGADQAAQDPVCLPQTADRKAPAAREREPMGRRAG